MIIEEQPILQRCMLVTVGVPGAGKSFFSDALVEQSHGNWARVNQDTLGSRQACESAAIQFIKKGKHVIIDR